MQKAYRCKECGRECADPVYLRLVLTRCGVVSVYRRVSEDGLKRHLAIPVGHLCMECVLAHVRTVVADGQALPKLQGFLNA